MRIRERIKIIGYGRITGEFPIKFCYQRTEGVYALLYLGRVNKEATWGTSDREQ